MPSPQNPSQHNIKKNKTDDYDHITNNNNKLICAYKTQTTDSAHFEACDVPKNKDSGHIKTKTKEYDHRQKSKGLC